MAEQPNILFIITDQQRFDHLGAAGLTGVKTPNLDRLASEGVHLTRGYCPSPICTPTRLSMLTGLYPSSHGGYTIGVTPDPFPEKTIPAALSSVGYKTGIVGKTHFVTRPEEEAHMAGGEKPSPDFFKTWTGPYAGFDYIQASTGHTINHIPSMHYRQFLEDAGVDYKPWFPQMGENYDHDMSGAWNIPAEYHDTTWVTDRTAEFIEQNKDQPWYCWASYQDPHEPYVCPEPYFSSVDTSAMPNYEFAREGEFDDKPSFYQKLYDAEIQEFNDGNGVPCVYRKERLEKQYKECMQATLGMIAFLDEKLGELLDKLEETGQLDKTLIVFTSDHGEMHGHHGFWGKGMTAYEDNQRVPLLVWGPKLFRRKGDCDSLVSLLDLPATFLELAGVEEYPHIQGQNLLPMLNEEVEKVQDEVIVECRANQFKLNQYTLITPTHKLVVFKGYELGELYDLANDPDQYTNLWNSPEHQTLKAELMERLVRKRMAAEPHFAPRKVFA